MPLLNAIWGIILGLELLYKTVVEPFSTLSLPTWLIAIIDSIEWHDINQVAPVLWAKVLIKNEWK